MRHKLMEILDEYDGLITYDSSTIDWTTFPWNESYIIHKVTKNQILKPYLIADQYYGNVDYEDIILLINLIEDVYEIIPGSELRIPDFEELQKWMLENTKSQ